MKGAWPTGDGIGAGGGSGANASMVVTPLARGGHLLGANGTDGVVNDAGGQDLPLPGNHLRSLDPLPSPGGAVAGEEGPFRRRRLLMPGLAASGGAQGHITP